MVITDGSKKDVCLLNMSDLFNNVQYIIPSYQRNYAWEYPQIEELMKDIMDSEGLYYLGILVVKSIGDNKFEVIDGQQRLTTLFLINIYLGLAVDKFSLLFETRKISNDTFKKLYDNVNIEEDDIVSEEILNGYENIKSFFAGKDKNCFIEKFNENIKLLRVEIPEDTDKNRYFEIMNTRGEQLKAHEIVKARLMKKLENEKERAAADLIWSVCSDMSTYVQMNFDKNCRTKIFGDDYNSFMPKNFDEFMNDAIGDAEINKKDRYKLFDILNGNSFEEEEVTKKDRDNEKFESIISFPDFILQVNGVMQSENYSLDDNKLIDILKPHHSSKEKVKEFLFCMLRYRYLFDKYIIKRNFHSYFHKCGRWSLQKIQREEIQYLSTYSSDLNNKIIMLQSCLRVTYTSPRTMNWITKVLRCVGENEDCDIIRELEVYCYEKLHESDYKNNSGIVIERIVFTVLDYILYCKGYADKEWTFQFRNSIEHFYPQNPYYGDKWDKKDCDSFGNLALITTSGNSKLSNASPLAKIENKEIINQSLKLKIMKEMTKKNNNEWTVETAKKHGNEMIILLDEFIEKYSI